MVNFPEWFVGARGRWFCTAYGCTFKTDDERLSIHHQAYHAKTEPQLLCRHARKCRDLQMHHDKTMMGIYD